MHLQNFTESNQKHTIITLYSQHYQLALEFYAFSLKLYITKTTDKLSRRAQGKVRCRKYMVAAELDEPRRVNRLT